VTPTGLGNIPALNLGVLTDAADDADDFLLRSYPASVMPPAITELMTIRQRPQRGGLVNVGRGYEPDQQHEYATSLLAAGWTADLLDDYLQPVFGELHPTKQIKTAGEILTSLLAWAYIPAAELDTWVRRVLGGNVSLLLSPHREKLRAVIDYWRATTEPGQAATMAADHYALPAATKIVRDRRATLPRLPELHPAQQWRHWCTQRLPADTDAGAWASGLSSESLRHLVGCGWTVDQVLTTVGEPIDVPLLADSIASLDFLTPAEVRMWRDALGIDLAALGEQHDILLRLHLAWRHTGVPADLHPLCLAAGVTPDEARHLHTAGHLNAESLRTLIALNAA